MKCAFCTADLGVGPAVHLCSRCGAPQPVRAGETFFGVFGFARPLFQFSPVEVEGLFYRVSRALHPDRFAAQGQESWRRASLERMSFLNEAFQTLKNREALRAYILKIEGLGASHPRPKAALPLELAESWFELQEAAFECSVEEFKERLSAFEKDLLARAEQVEHVARGLEQEYDQAEEAGSRRAVLEKLALRLQDLQYHRSLFRDVGRLRSTASGVA